MRSVQLTLSAAQLLALIGTPVQILPAPGAGKFYSVVAAAAYYKFKTTPFTIAGAPNIQLATPGASIYFEDFAATMLDQASDQLYQLVYWFTVYPATDFVNQPMNIRQDVGTLTLGDGSLTFYVDYNIKDAPV